MQQFEGRVAVVTGAGGKVGLSLSRRFAREGMSVVLADVNAEDLATSQAQLTREGIAADRLLTVETDVTSSGSVQRLADAAVEAFGGVHVVCNNAGVNPQDLSIWEATEEDWRWALGVNLWGAIHGPRSRRAAWRPSARLRRAAARRPRGGCRARPRRGRRRSRSSPCARPCSRGQ